MARRHLHCGFIDAVTAAVDIAMLRALAGGRELSGDMLLILIFVAFDDYELFPARKEAARAGSKVD